LDGSGFIRFDTEEKIRLSDKRADWPLHYTIVSWSSSPILHYPRAILFFFHSCLIVFAYQKNRPFPDLSFILIYIRLTKHSLLFFYEFSCTLTHQITHILSSTHKTPRREQSTPLGH
jgi:hypothetical protein